MVGVAHVKNAPHVKNTPHVKPVAIPTKSALMAYFLLVFGGGTFGAHHIYLGNYTCALAYAWTVGLGGLGPIYDLFTLWYQVKAINKRNGATGEADVQVFAILKKLLFKWLPMAVCVCALSVWVFVVYAPFAFDRLGLVDLYAIKADMDKNPFDVLEVPRYSAFDVSKKNFRALSLKYHPDRNPDCADCAARMTELNNAYSGLKKAEDPENASWTADWEALFEHYAQRSSDYEDDEEVPKKKKGKGKKGKKGKKEKKEKKDGMFAQFVDQLFEAAEDDEL